MVSWIPVVASFFVVGLGQALKGEFGKGLKFFLSFVTLAAIRFAGLFILAVDAPEIASILVPILAPATALVMAVIYFVQLADAFGVIDAADHVPYL